MIISARRLNSQELTSLNERISHQGFNSAIDNIGILCIKYHVEVAISHKKKFFTQKIEAMFLKIQVREKMIQLKNLFLNITCRSVILFLKDPTATFKKYIYMKNTKIRAK